MRVFKYAEPPSCVLLEVCRSILLSSKKDWYSRCAILIRSPSSVDRSSRDSVTIRSIGLVRSFDSIDPIAAVIDHWSEQLPERALLRGLRNNLQTALVGLRDMVFLFFPSSPSIGRSKAVK